MTIRIFQHCLFGISCLLFSFSLTGSDESPSFEFINSAKDSKNEQPTLFTPDQLATLTGDANQLIGGLISPQSGNLYLQQNDMIVRGAQEIPLNRIYIAPYMPQWFNKNFDRDCYERRLHLLEHYEGWKFFPHVRLWRDLGKGEIHIINPNGAAYDFSFSKGKTSLVQAYAVNNVGEKEIPSGRYDPRNTRISEEGIAITVFSPDGSTRYYYPKVGSLYLLDKEYLPNGKMFKYHYTEAGELTRIESLDLNERHVYATLEILGLPKDGTCKFLSSTGQTASYVYENRCVGGKFRDKFKTNYNFIMPPLLTEVNSPQNQKEKTEHESISLLIDSFSGKNEIFALSRSGFGQGNKNHLRVEKLLFPVGPNDSLVPVYMMNYEPAVAGEKEGTTTVRHHNGTTTIYHFSKDLLTTSIQYFCKEGPLKKEKIFSWDTNNRLSFVELRDEGNNLIFKKSYQYDIYGNPTLETFTGDLQDSYSIKREFSQDGRHLLLREETDEGKVTIFEYLPGTNLVATKLIQGGIRETYEYDECYNLIHRRHDSGHCTTITTYHLRQQAPFLHMPEWVEEKYLECGDEKLLKRTHLIYDQWGNISEEQIYGSLGNYAYSLFKEYDEQGNLLSETNPLGQQRTFAYDEKGHCLAKTSFSQNLTESMSYDTKGRLSERKEGIHSELYDYDFNDNLIQQIDTYKNVIIYEYDPLTQKRTNIYYPSSVTTSSTYDPFGREISKTDANGQTTFYRYNAFNTPIEITYPNGDKEYYTYTKNGKVASHTDRGGLTITYTYDVLGRVISKRYGNDLGEERFVYDGLQLIEEVDLEGNITRYSYDGAGRKIREDKSGRITHYAYDPLGRVETISQEGLRTHYTRDLLNRVLEERKTDIQGKLLYKISYGYNEEGELSQIIRHIDGKKSIESYTYDSFGRETEHQDPFGYKTTTVYDENHINELGQKVLQVSTTDPKGLITIETKDPFFRTVKEEKKSPQGFTIAYWEKSYDPNGNVIDWKEHVYEDRHYRETQWTHFRYTSENQVASVTRAYGTPESRTTYYSYGINGKVKTKTLPDNTTLSYTYTALGFLASLSSSDGKIKHRYTCNKNGKLIFTQDDVDNIVIRRDVDSFGNVTRELFPFIEVRKYYDCFDRLTELNFSKGGSVSYTYDPLYLRNVSRFNTDGILQYEHQYEKYDLDGNLLSEIMILDSGRASHHYDLKGRKTILNSPYFSQKRFYNECDNLIGNEIDSESLTYTYDDLSQLISDDEHEFGYDSAHNRIKKDDELFKTNALNELHDQSYDLNGNQIRKGEIQFSYDPLNRLREAILNDKKIQFLYDPLGRRLTKIGLTKKGSIWEETSRENYFYDGHQEIGSFASDGTLKNFRVLGGEIHPELPATVAIELGNKRYATQVDADGNICRLIAPSSKKVISRYEFSPFGEEKYDVVDENPWRYASKRFDPELCLIYFGKRDYDPELGRWMTTDPAGFVDSLNLYQYVLNNPFSNYDPNGEFAFTIPLIMWGVELILPSLSAYIAPILIDAAIATLQYYAVFKTARTINQAINQNPDVYDYSKANRNAKKHREENYPGEPKDLEKNPDWKETTHPGQAKSGKREFENTKTGEKIRYDKGDSKGSGHSANDHYHRLKPRPGAQGEYDYVDKNGNVVPKGHDASHLYSPEGRPWN